MKTKLIRLGVIALASSFVLVLAAQNIQHETTAINIEIPVRVFKGNVFVDNLTINDFEVYDDGELQTLEAVYLVKRTNIERREENRTYLPDTGRHFYLFFEMGDYDAKIRPGLEYFVKEVLLPGDDLIIVTPMKSYRMKSETFKVVGRNKVFDDLMGLLRRDILIGTAEYRSTLQELKGLAQVISSQVPVSIDSTRSTGVLVDDAGSSAALFSEEGVSPEEMLQKYLATLSRLERLRVVEQARLLDFAERLKNQSGQKEVFLFYQKEYLPKLDPKILMAYEWAFNERPDISQTLTSLFDTFRRETPLNIDFVKKAYADASAAIHFLFISRPAATIPGIVMADQSEDIYSAFMEMSRATGGYADASANVEFSMKSAVAASENYYLLYYAPKNYRSDKRFHNLIVRVKSGNYRISHRLGYNAD